MRVARPAARWFGVVVVRSVRGGLRGFSGEVGSPGLVGSLSLSRAVSKVTLLTSGVVFPGPVVPDTGQPCGEWPVSGPTGRQGRIISTCFGLRIFCPTRIY